MNAWISGPGNGTLYNSLHCTPFQKVDSSETTIGSSSQETYTERLVWGNSDGRGLGSAYFRRARGWIDLLGALDASQRMAMHNSGELTSRRGVANGPRVTPTSLYEALRLQADVSFWRLNTVMPAEICLASFVMEPLLSGGSQWIERGGSAIIGPRLSIFLTSVRGIWAGIWI